MENDNFNNLNNAMFMVLKPVCDQLIVDVNDKAVFDFTRVLETLPANAIQSFQSYICFPIEIQIIRATSNKKKQLLVDLLRKVILSRSQIDEVKILLRISTLLYQQVVNSSDSTKVSNVAEELKLSVVLCIAQLWKSAERQTLYNVYCRDTFPRISPIVYMLVQLAKNEKLTELRVAALEALQVLCHVHSDAHINDLELQQRVREVVKLMFPGITSCCFTIANEPAILNHKVTCVNISLWNGLVTMVMADSITDQKLVDWQVETAQKLIPVMEAVLRTQTHSHWQVRRGLTSAVINLLSSCSRSLSCSVGSLMCCLIVLSEDEMVQVSAPATDGLLQLSSELDHDTGQPLLQLVQSAFYSLMSRAPRIMQGTDEGSQLTCLCLLVGYLRLQGSKLPQVLSSRPFLHRLLVTLAVVCRLETSHVTLLEDCSIKEVETDVSAHEPWKQLVYLNTTQKLRKFHDMCSVLRQSADLCVITHALLDMLDSNPELTKEVVLLLNTILGGGGPESMLSQAELVKAVVGTYLQPSLWAVPLSDISLQEEQSNVVQVSLLAEGVGQLAVALGSKHFSSCLLRCLYPLLECAGSPLHTLAAAGLKGVHWLAEVCSGGSVTQLVCTNSDYLSHHITLRLRRAHQSPGVLSVLSVVMRHSTMQVLPSLQEIIEDVLAQSYDEFQDHNTNGFLRVFLTFVKCVRGWQQSQSSSDATSEDQTIATSCPPALLNQLLEYKRLVNTAENLDDDNDADAVDAEEGLCEKQFSTSARENDQNEEPESEREEAKPVVKLTVAVIVRALHFLPSKDQQRQILVLDILLEGVHVLASDEDQLLPVVHKIWSPLVNRFQTSVTQPLIVHRAFLLLCTLASVARDFIRSRTLKQVLPSLCQVLIRSAEASVLKDSGSAYRLTQQYKLQHAVLSHLGPLAQDLALQEKEVHQLLMSASPYLSSCQPPPLQECCMAFFKQVGSSYPDLVWVQLVSLWYPTTTLAPPSSLVRTIQVEVDCGLTSEFRKNVSELLLKNFGQNTLDS